MNVAPIHSIYIPRMSVYTTEQNIAMEFQEWGPIARIDFTPINKKPGFTEDMMSELKSAFIHFYYALSSEHTKLVLIQQNQAYKMYLKYGIGYWLVLQNKSPVPYTMMNTSQIVDNCRYLEQRVEQQQCTIDELKAALEAVQQQVYLLISPI